MEHIRNIVQKLLVNLSHTIPFGYDIPKKVHQCSSELIAEILDHFCIKHQLVNRKIILNKVSVDLGCIDAKEFAHVFSERLAEVLPGLLETQLEDPSPKLRSGLGGDKDKDHTDINAYHCRDKNGNNPYILAAIDGRNLTSDSLPEDEYTSLVIITYFFETGQLSAQARHPLSIEKLIDELLAENLAAFSKLVKRMAGKGKPRRRMAHHFNDDQIIQLVFYLSGPIISRMVEVLLKRSGKTTKDLDYDQTLERVVVLETLLKQLSKSDTPPRAPVMLKQTLEALAEGWNLTLNQILQIIQEVEDSTDFQLMIKELDLQRDELNRLTIKDPNFSEITGTIGLKVVDGKTESNKNEDAGYPKMKTVPVQHAGIVLLWPFLEGFFSKLELIEQSNFLGNYKQVKAIYLLQYLATGRTSAEEYELAIFKILCGMPIDEPIPTSLDLTKEEEVFSDGLIGAMIKNWGAIGDTDIHSIRTTFLQREGWLSERENSFLLEVPKDTWDILLDSLPWGIGVVQLPWMNEMLHIKWE